MLNIADVIKPKYLIDEKGHKTAVVINLKDYNNLIEFIEDMKDANDILRAEKKATGFTPYERFRQRWLKIKTSLPFPKIQDLTGAKN